MRATAFSVAMVVILSSESSTTYLCCGLFHHGNIMDDGLVCSRVLQDYLENIGQLNGDAATMTREQGKKFTT